MWNIIKWKNKTGLIPQILMVGFSGFLDTGWAEDL